MKRYNVKLGGGSMLLTETDIAVLFRSGKIDRDTPCCDGSNNGWHTVDELFPFLKHESKGAPTSGFARYPDAIGSPKPPRAQNTSVTAGWICFGIGAAVSWIFPPAYFFFSVAIILAIVAMATNQVSRGVILMLSSVIGLGASMLISFMLAVGLFAAAAGHAISQADAQLQRQQALMTQQMNQASQRLTQALPPPPAPNFGAPTASADDLTRQLNQVLGNVNQTTARPAVWATPIATPAPLATPRFDNSVDAQLRRIAQQKQRRDWYKMQSESLRKSIDYWQGASRGSKKDGRAFADSQVDLLQKELQKLNSENPGM